MMGKFDLFILKTIKKLYYRNEPFDFVRWFICVACILFRKSYVKASNIDKAISKFASSEIISDHRLHKKLFYDMLYSALVFGTSSEEYFYFKFDSKTYAERRKYITEHQRALEFTTLVNDSIDKSIFSDKYETYMKFKNYYCRDAILINTYTNYKDFSLFASKHVKFVCKFTNGNSGNGVKLVDSSTYNSHEAIFNELLKGEECILEELVVQAPEMAALNPSSVNTVRVPAVLTKDGVKILYPVLKVGQSNSFVDNAGAGGIMALIDLETGIICDTPMDESNKRYLVHPDTGAQLIGFKMPRWNEAVDLVNKLAYVVPTVRYVGWDLALTKNGWIVIEGNDDGMFIGQQMLDQIGKKEAYYSLINAI